MVVVAWLCWRFLLLSTNAVGWLSRPLPPAMPPLPLSSGWLLGRAVPAISWDGARCHWVCPPSGQQGDGDSESGGGGSKGRRLPQLRPRITSRGGGVSSALLLLTQYLRRTAWLTSGSLPLSRRGSNYLPSNHLLFENPRDRCLFDLCGPKSTLLSLFTNHVDAAGTGFDLVKGTRPSV